MSNDATTDKDLDNRLSKASRSFGHLSKRVWQDHCLRISTKLKVYRAVIIPTLLYGAKSWVLYRKQMRRLEQFHQHCLRKILNIKWQEFVSNEEVLEIEPNEHRSHTHETSTEVVRSRDEDG